MATRHVWLIGTAWVAACLCVAAFILIGAWGFLLDRPHVDPKILALDHIISITPFTLEVMADGTPRLAIDHKELSYDLKRHFSPEATGRRHIDFEDWKYYCLSERHLLELRKRGKAVDTYKPAPIPKNLRAELLKTGQILSSAQGYDSTKHMSGIVTIGKLNDKKYTVVALKGGEVANDSYPFYEFLFSGEEPTAHGLLSATRFKYDVAGIEGADGWRVWLVLSAVFVAVSAPIFVPIIGFMKRKHYWASHGRQAFPQSLAL